MVSPISYDAAFHTSQSLIGFDAVAIKKSIFRHFDFVSELRRGLPHGQKLVALELGIASAVEDLLPALKGALVTLEHPILESEWAVARQRAGTQAFRVGFLGHCGKGKGFDYFVQLADRHTSERVSSSTRSASRIPNASDLDLSALKREPSRVHVPRDEYLSCVAAMDLICLPLPKTYEYVASGSVIDAVAATKPLALLRNRVFDALVDSYGPIGPMVHDHQALDEFFASVTLQTFEQNRPTWVESLERIRVARRPEALAAGYRATIF